MHRPGKIEIKEGRSKAGQVLSLPNSNVLQIQQIANSANSTSTDKANGWIKKKWLENCLWSIPRNFM